MLKEKIQPEMKDIIEAIMRWTIVNKQEVSFIGSFVAFDKQGDVKEEAERIFIYGDKELLRIQLDALKEELDKNTDENEIAS